MPLFSPYLDFTDFDDSDKSGEGTTHQHHNHQPQTKQTNDGEAEDEVAECLLGLSSHTKSPFAQLLHQPPPPAAAAAASLDKVIVVDVEQLPINKGKNYYGHTKCNVEGCTKFSQKGGVCLKHKALGKVVVAVVVNKVEHQPALKKKKGGYKKCNVEGCTKFAQKGGVCVKHGAIVNSHKKCNVDGCTNLSRRRGVCVKHGAKRPMEGTAAANAAPDDDNHDRGLSSDIIIHRPHLPPGMERRYPFNTEISKPQPLRTKIELFTAAKKPAADVAVATTAGVTKPTVLFSTTASEGDGPSKKKPRLIAAEVAAFNIYTSVGGTKPSSSELSKPAATVTTTLIANQNKLPILLNNNKKQPPQPSQSSKLILATSSSISSTPNNPSSIPSKGNTASKGNTNINSGNSKTSSTSSPPAAATEADYATEYLKAWMNHPNHIHHPYPNAEQRITIMNDTGLTVQQMAMWFVNYRETYWKKPAAANDDTTGDTAKDTNDVNDANGNDTAGNDKGGGNDNDVSVVAVAQNEKKPDNKGDESSVSICHNEPMARVDVPNPLIAQPPTDNKKKDGMVSDSDNESIIKEQQATIDCNQKKKMLPSQQQALQSTNFEFALTEEDFIDCNQKKMLPSPQQALQNTSDNESIKEQQATIDCNQKKMMLPSQQQALQSTNFEFALTEEDFTDCNQKKMLPSQQKALQNRPDSESIKEQQATIDCNQKKMMLPSQQQALQFCGVEQNLTFQFRGKPGLPVTQNTNFEFALTEEDFASSKNDDELEQQASSSAQEQQQKQKQYLKQYLQQQLQHQQHAASSSSSTSICFYPASSHEVGYNKQDAMWWKKFYELEAFKKEHGHVDVKQKWEKDPSLGVWVNTQRTMMHKWEKDIANGTPIEKIKRYWRVPLLKGIGFKSTIGKGSCGERPERFISTTNLNLWDSRFADLVKYKETHGNCEVKLMDPQYKSLGRWVGNQRKQFRELYQHEKQQHQSWSKEHHPVLYIPKKTRTGVRKLMAIDLERYQKLKDIGFTFAIRYVPDHRCLREDVGSAIEEEEKKRVPTIEEWKDIVLPQPLGQQQFKPADEEKIPAFCSGLKANDDVANISVDNKKKCGQREDGASNSIGKKAPLIVEPIKKPSSEVKRAEKTKKSASSPIEKKAPPIIEPNKKPSSEVKPAEKMTIEKKAPPIVEPNKKPSSEVKPAEKMKKKSWYECAYAMVKKGEKKAAVVQKEAIRSTMMEVMNKTSQQPSSLIRYINESSVSPKAVSSSTTNSSLFSNSMPSDPEVNNCSVPNPVTHDC